MSQSGFRHGGVRHGTVAHRARPHFPRAARREGVHRNPGARPDRMAYHGRHGHKFARFGKHHGFFPHQTWWYPDTGSYAAPVLYDEGQAPMPQHVPIGIPSLADLPVSTGIGQTPVGSPIIYVVNGRRSVRRGGGAKILDMDGTGSDATPSSTGPRVIHLTVPQGR